MSLPLPELFQFERWLEEGFKEILIAVAPKTFTSRDPNTAETPRNIIRATVMELASAHVHPFADKTSVYDSFTGEVEVEVTTNRVTTAKDNSHYEMLGGVRAVMVDFLVQRNWSTANPLRIDDVRPQDATHSVEDEGSLDKTALKFYLVFNVNPSQWPSSL